MITFLKKSRICSEVMTQLMNYIKSEEFDTDGILLDIEKNSSGRTKGNIARIMKNENLMTMIRNFIQNSQS